MLQDHVLVGGSGIDAYHERWTSKVYDHYDILLQHTTGPPKKITFIFMYKHRSATHEPHKHTWGNTAAGTTNMQKSASKCDASRGLTGSLTLTTSSTTAIPYTEGTHHAIIAFRCVTSHWPFNSVSDKYYKMEVECLCPGTKLPALKTVLLDINYLYLELLKSVWAYFKVCIQLIYNPKLLINW